MHDRRNPILSPPLDLSRYSEKTRRALYDRIEADHFAPDPSTILGALVRGADDRGDYVETRSAEEAGLAVHYLLGRWFAVWRVADPIDRPTERDLWEVVTISASPRGVLSMAEV